MRPITISRIITVCLLALRYKIITEARMTDDLKMSRNRVREVASELCKMNLLDNIGNKKFCSNTNTSHFIGSFRTGSWNKFSEYLYQNCKQYKLLVDLLEGYQGTEHGKTMEELLEEISKKHLPLNRASLAVLTNWGERLGQIQRNLYNGRFYFVKRKPLTFAQFNTTFVGSYSSLNLRVGVDLKSIYVEVPRMRELVCERLKISREFFDNMLSKVYWRNFGSIEFSGAPITTITKKSRYSIRTLTKKSEESDEEINDDAKKYQILSVKLDLEKERKGIMINEKEYYYVALHKKLT